jgi:hypothetical protein
MFTSVAIHATNHMPTKYVEVQALALHVLVQQHPLVALVAVREESDQVVVPELGRHFHFPKEIAEEYSAGKR